MFRFFRLLRKKLIEDGHLNKYFWYAIGEVFLVVIGILIALQINNWNIERQTRNEEKTYLINLKNDLKINLRLLDQILEYNERNIISTANVSDMAEQGRVEDIYHFINNIAVTMGVNNFTPNQNTFEEMKSSGKLSLITNEYIKQRLLALDEQFVLIESGEAHVQREYEEYLWDEFVNQVNYGGFFIRKTFRENFILTLDSAFIEANEQELLIQANRILANYRFKNGLYLYELNYVYLNTVFKETKTMVEELIELIDQELVD